MSIFESGVRAGRRAVGAGLASGAVDAERLRRNGEHYGPAQPDGARAALAELALAVSRLFFPTMLLLVAAAAAVIYGNTPAPWFGNIAIGGKPFEMGVLALPLTLFIVQLTNRRYGAAYAFFQVLGAAGLVAVAAVYLNGDLAMLRGAALPAPRLVAGFGTGLFIAQLFSIIVFDRLRGPQWWQAPFFATLFGGVVLALVAYPAAYAGKGADWFAPMMAFMGIAALGSLLLLVPYWLLRALIAPLPGFGGY